MLQKLELLYDATVRPLGPLHRLARALVWRAGDGVVRAVSPLVRFELPPDRLLPLYKLQMLLGTYERRTARTCRRLLRPGMIAVDVGAHAGYYTLLFSRLVGASGRVLAFEPHPANRAILERNVQRRGLRNVRVFPFAASDREGRASFWQTPLSMGHSLLPGKSGTRALDVETIPLDALCAREGIGAVHLIKMDVEGSEPEVLAGMKALAARSPGLALIMEFKPELFRRRADDVGHWLRSLADLGFTQLQAIRERGPLTPVAIEDGAALAAAGKCNLLAVRA